MGVHVDLKERTKVLVQSIKCATWSGEYISPPYQSLESMGEIVKIDVGGTTFSTTK